MSLPGVSKDRKVRFTELFPPPGHVDSSTALLTGRLSQVDAPGGSRALELSSGRAAP